MAYESNTGLNVSNQYGSRFTGGAVGIETSALSDITLRIDLTGQSIADAIAGFVPPYFVPKGANFNSARLRVDEAFVLGGTTPAVSIGAAGSVGTNFVSLSQTELQTIGTKEIVSAGAGTWAFASTVGTAAAAKVAFALTGTAPTVTSGVGKATLILSFTFATKI